MALADVYKPDGAVVGYLTKGDDANDVRGVIDRDVYGGQLIGKGVVARHINGTYHFVEITSFSGSGNRVNFTGKWTGPAANKIWRNGQWTDFVPQPFSSLDSALAAIGNTLEFRSDTQQGQGLQAPPVWAMAGGALLIFALLSSQKK